MTRIWTKPVSRRRFLALGASTLATSVLGRAFAQTSEPRLRVGVVLPSRHDVGAASFGAEAVGEASRLGATLAEEMYGDLAQEAGFRLEVLQATAPDPDSAERAARRFVEMGAVALLGGTTPEQAPPLAAVASGSGVPFLNLGDGDQGGCGGAAIRVGATPSMYLTALAAWFRGQDKERWHAVVTTGEPWTERLATLQAAAGGSSFTVSTVPPQGVVFSAAIREAAAAQADLVILLMDGSAQLDFVSQYEEDGTGAVVTGYPAAATQLRSFYAALLQSAPLTSTGARVALWDAALTAPEAARLNAGFVSRWGRPLDPPAWATYAGVAMAVTAAVSKGTNSAGDVRLYLESERPPFHIGKGDSTTLRLTDMQLRQPLYLVAPREEAPLGTSPTELTGLAAPLGQLPAAAEDGGSTKEWDETFPPSARC